MSKNVPVSSPSSDPGPETRLTPTRKPEFVFRALIMAAAIVVVLAGVKAASAIIAPMLLALFATIILLVPLRWLKSIGCPSILAMIIVLGSVAVLFFGLTRVAVRSVADLGKDAPKYAKKIEETFQEFEKQLEEWGFRLNTGWEWWKTSEHLENGGMVPHENGTGAAEKNIAQVKEPPGGSPPLTSAVTEAEETAEFGESGEVEENTENDSKSEVDAALKAPPSLINLNAQNMMAWLTLAVTELRHLIEKSFLTLIITLFMIFEASNFSVKIERALGKGPITSEHFHKIASQIRRYLFLKAFTSIISGTAAMMVYIAFGVPGAIFWGLVAIFLYFIPNLGGTIAAVIPGLLIFVKDGPYAVLIYALFLITIECTLGYGIEPKILGHGLSISTVVIILSLIVWGWLLGAIGLFLAAPLTIMVKIILQAFKETEWVAILIGDGTDRS